MLPVRHVETCPGTPWFCFGLNSTTSNYNNDQLLVNNATVETHWKSFIPDSNSGIEHKNSTVEENYLEFPFSV